MTPTRQAIARPTDDSAVGNLAIGGVGGGAIANRAAGRDAVAALPRGGEIRVLDSPGVSSVADAVAHLVHIVFTLSCVGLSTYAAHSLTVRGYGELACAIFLVLMLHNFIALSPNPYEATQPRNTLTPTASVVFVTIVGVLLCGCVLRTWSIAELHLSHPWAAPASFAAFPLAAIACSDSAAKLAARHREFVHDCWHFMMCAVAFAATYSVCFLATLSGRTPPPRPTTSHGAHAHTTSSTDLTTTDAYFGAITLWVQRDEDSPLDVVTWFVIQAASAVVCTVVLISLTQLGDGNGTREHDDDVPAGKADARAPIKIGSCVRHPFKSGHDIGGRDYDVTGDGSIAVVDACEGDGNIYFTFYQRRDDEWCARDSIIVGIYKNSGWPVNINVRVSHRSGAKIITWLRFCSESLMLTYTLLDKDNSIVVQNQDANIRTSEFHDVAIDDKGAAVIVARRTAGESNVDVVFIDDRGREIRRMVWPLEHTSSTVKVALNPTTGDGIVLAQQQAHGPWPHKCNMYVAPTHFIDDNVPLNIT